MSISQSGRLSDYCPSCAANGSPRSTAVEAQTIVHSGQSLLHAPSENFSD